MILGYDQNGQLGTHYFGNIALTRWSNDILHGISNVRGGYCCKQFPLGGLHFAPEQPFLLGIGHLQRIRRPDENHKGDFARYLRVQKTRAYTQFFYALRADFPFDVIGVSPELYFDTNSKFGNGWKTVSEAACESIQLATGLIIQDKNGSVWNKYDNHYANAEVTVAYGINDCESRLLRIPVNDVLGMLQPTDSREVDPESYFDD